MKAKRKHSHGTRHEAANGTSGLISEVVRLQKNKDGELVIDNE